MNELDEIFTEVAVEAQKETDELVDKTYQAPFKHWIDTEYYDVNFDNCLSYLKKVFRTMPDVRFTDDFKYHPLLDKNFIKNREHTLIFDFNRASYNLLKCVFDIIYDAAEKYGVMHNLRIDTRLLRNNFKNLSVEDSRAEFIMNSYNETMLKNMQPGDRTYFGAYHWYDLHRNDANEREIIYSNLEDKCKIRILKQISGCILENIPIRLNANEMEELNGIFDDYSIPDVVMARKRIEGMQGVRFDIYYMGMDELRSHMFRHSGFAFPNQFIIGKTEVWRMVDGRIVIICSFKNHNPCQRAFVTMTLAFRKRQFNWETIKKAMDLIFRRSNNSLELDEKVGLLKKSLCPLEYSNKRNKLMRLYA